MAGPLEVEGARKLRASLKQAGLDVQDLKDAHKAVAEMVLEKSRPKAPRRTGRLAGDARAAGQASAAIVRIGRKSVPYAGPIHWGWPSRGIKPNPWLWETAQTTHDAWENTYLQALETIIDRIEGAPGP